MEKLSFKRVFELRGIRGMGGIHTLWCKPDASGLLVLMTNADHLKKSRIPGIHKMFHNPGDPSVHYQSKVRESLDMLEAYFEVGKPILLLEGFFALKKGKIKFDYASGFAYMAYLTAFDRETGVIEARIPERRFELG